MENIRNFSIIAHIDHGKSTLADRLLEVTGLKTAHQNKNDRTLDVLELEQEKGITIKLQPVRMSFNGHILNLIDTPGHVDFAYEVSRSLAACEGAILLVDASQGVQAQTLSTLGKAKKLGLKIIPVLNKIDLPNVDIASAKKELVELLNFSEDEIILASGKTGEGANDVLDAVIKRIPQPSGDINKPLKALIFDSFYHEHKGVTVAIRIFDGKISNVNSQLHLIKAQNQFKPKEIGYFSPDFVPTKNLNTGDVCYISTGLKDIKLFTVGDTISDTENTEALSGYKPPKPKVFATLFPSNPDDFPILSDALTKLSMSDAALTVLQQKSAILGSGFRCGFLGMLHMEIVQERLEREYNVDLVITAPSVEYQIKLDTDKIIGVQTSDDFPDPSQIKEAYEPWVQVSIFTPQEHMGPVMQLCQDYRGIYKDSDYINQNTSNLNYLIIKYEIPMMSLISKFFDRLKSVSHGYASMDYKFLDYRPADIVKVSILVNQDEVSSLSFLEIRENADEKSRKILATLKKSIPKHQFKIALQAAIGGKILAREDISAFRKDVTGKLYGGDITRKKKLLEKQKKGKKRLKEIGGVNIPQKAFLAVLEG